MDWPAVAPEQWLVIDASEGGGRSSSDLWIGTVSFGRDVSGLRKRLEAGWDETRPRAKATTVGIRQRLCGTSFIHRLGGGKEKQISILWHSVRWWWWRRRWHFVFVVVQENDDESQCDDACICRHVRLGNTQSDAFSVCVCACLCVCLYACLYVTVSLSLCLCVCLPLYMSACLSLCLPMYLSVRLSYEPNSSGCLAKRL